MLLDSGMGQLDENKSVFFGGQFCKLGRIISWVELFPPRAISELYINTLESVLTIDIILPTPMNYTTA